MPKKLGVFLLSYKRPAFILETIDSILAQDYADYDLIISENTPDDSVIEQLQKYSSYQHVRMEKRTPSLASLTHFNRILSEASHYEYVMLFHDDDLLQPGALTKMMAAIQSKKSFSAVSCNAFLLRNSGSKTLLFNPNLTRETIIETQTELINRYIFKKLSHTPFPSYIYRTRFLDGLRLDANEGGKYADASFLVKLIKRGPFVWLSEPLMKYRQHSGNDSVNLNMKDILSLCLFFYKTSPKMIPKIIFYYSKQLVKKLFFS